MRACEKQALHLKIWAAKEILSAVIMIENIINKIKHKDGYYYFQLNSYILRSAFQKIFNDNDEIYGYESFLRVSKSGENIAPDVFFEKYKYSYEKSLYLNVISLVLHIKNFSLYSAREKLFLNVPPIFIEKNITPDIVNEILFFIDNISMKNHIVVEILEVCDGSNEIIKDNVNILKSKGFYIAMDDITSCACCVYRAKCLKPCYLKLDRSIVSKSTVDTEELKIMIKLAKDIDSKVIFEGVETEKEFKVGRRFSIPLYQGYYLSKPELF